MPVVSAMRAGKLRKRVLIQIPEQTQMEDGGQESTWVTLTEVWAEIAPLRMFERQVDRQVTARESHMVTIRWTHSLPPDARLVQKGTGRIFEVTAQRNLDERNRTMELAVIEKPAVSLAF